MSDSEEPVPDDIINSKPDELPKPKLKRERTEAQKLQWKKCLAARHERIRSLKKPEPPTPPPSPEPEPSPEPPAIDLDVDGLADMIATRLHLRQQPAPAPAPAPFVLNYV